VMSDSPKCASFVLRLTNDRANRRRSGWPRTCRGDEERAPKGTCRRWGRHLDIEDYFAL